MLQSCVHSGDDNAFVRLEARFRYGKRTKFSFGKFQNTDSDVSLVSRRSCVWFGMCQRALSVLNVGTDGRDTLPVKDRLEATYYFLLQVRNLAMLPRSYGWTVLIIEVAPGVCPFVCPFVLYDVHTAGRC